MMAMPQKLALHASTEGSKEKLLKRMLITAAVINASLMFFLYSEKDSA